MKETNRRQNLINNVLDLSVNTGKINEKVNFMVYSEEEKKEKQKKIKEIKNDINNAMNNLKKIAESLEIDLEE